MDQESIEKIRHIIVELLKQMGIEATVEAEDSIIAGLVFNIASEDSYLLIGRGGATLHALQYIVWQLALRELGTDKWPRFSIDVDDYKRKREWYLKETAKQAVEKLNRIGGQITLEPMPNYERRFIHTIIQKQFPNVSSESVGIDPRRRVVLRKH